MAETDGRFQSNTILSVGPKAQQKDIRPEAQHNEARPIMGLLTERNCGQKHLMPEAIAIGDWLAMQLSEWGGL